MLFGEIIKSIKIRDLKVFLPDIYNDPQPGQITLKERICRHEEGKSSSIFIYALPN